MADSAGPACGLAGCGRLVDTLGEPIRPGGDAIIAELVERAGIRPGAHVLDVGCGAGDSLAWLERRGYAGAGVDRDGATLALAATRTGAPLFHADGLRLPFPRGRFDAVLSECSLSLMPNRKAALAEWRRVLKPRGRLMIADVDRAGDDDPLLRDVKAAGFEILHDEDRSDVLAGFAARFIFRYGSLDALWNGGGPKGKACYRLLVAESTVDDTRSPQP